MLKMISGVIAGFMVWSTVWVGLDSFLATLSPDWFGKNMTDFQNAVERHENFMTPISVSVYLILQSVVCSLLAGFTAVLIAKETRKTTLALGILLLITGIFVEAMNWNYMLTWYHTVFLLLLIPMTILGGRLRSGK